MSKDNYFWKGVKHFKQSEFYCKCGCGLNHVNYNFIDRLDTARVISELPFIISSSIRCKTHNKNINGSSTSSHLLGLAVDIKVFDSKSRFKILESLMIAGFTRIGIYKDFIHVDYDLSKTQYVIWYG